MSYSYFFGGGGHAMTGQELREIRSRCGRQRGQRMGAAEFAAVLDVAYSTYRRWEATDGPIPRVAAALLQAHLRLAALTTPGGDMETGRL